MAPGVKSAVWVGIVATAAIGSYLVSLNVAKERSQLALVEKQIVQTYAEIKILRSLIAARERGAAPIDPAPIEVRCTFQIEADGLMEQLHVATTNLTNPERATMLIALPYRVRPPESPQAPLMGILKTWKFDAILVRRIGSYEGIFSLEQPNQDDYAIEEWRSGQSLRIDPPKLDVLQLYSSSIFTAPVAPYTCTRLFVRVPRGYRIIEKGATVEATRPMLREISLRDPERAGVQLVVPDEEIGAFLRGSAFNILTMLLGIITTILGSGLKPKTYRNIVFGYSACSIAYLVGGAYALYHGSFTIGDELLNVAVGIAGLAVVWLPFRKSFTATADPQPRP